MDRDQQLDERHAARHRLGFTLRRIRAESGYSTQASLARELARRDPDGTKTVETWTKTVSNAERGVGIPNPLHLAWCGQHTNRADELRNAVRVAAELCRWRKLTDWGADAQSTPRGFTGVKSLLDRSGFSYDVEAIEPTQVVWFHRLRAPHLIHGIFSLAAASALRSGLSVELVLDDTQLADSEEADYLVDRWSIALSHWLGQADLGRDDLKVRRFSNILEVATADVDAWELFERYLDSMSLVQLLRAAKVVPLTITSTSDPVVVLPGAGATRLLTPFFNWVVLEHLVEGELAADSTSAVVTLGGADEQVLWERWQRSGLSREVRDQTGHIYLARMPLPKPPWQYRALTWRGRGMVNGGLGALFDAVAEDAESPREAVADLAEWLYRAGVTLALDLELPNVSPYVGQAVDGSVEDVRRAAINEPRNVARALAESIGSWFYT